MKKLIPIKLHDGYKRIWASISFKNKNPLKKIKNQMMLMDKKHEGRIIFCIFYFTKQDVDITQ